MRQTTMLKALKALAAVATILTMMMVLSSAAFIVTVAHAQAYEPDLATQTGVLDPTFWNALRPRLGTGVSLLEQTVKDAVRDTVAVVGETNRVGRALTAP